MITGDHIRTIGAIVTIGTGLAVFTWFIAKLESRMSALELQVHTLTVAPALAASGPGAQHGQTVANPVAQACAQLALDAASGKGGYTASNNTYYMEKLGCGSAGSKNPN